MSTQRRKRKHKYSLAWITGGSSGIGLSIAGALARRGTDILLIARNTERLSIARSSVAALRRSEAQRIETLSCDVSDAKTTGKLLGEAVERLGVPDLVINCAGIAYPNYFDSIPAERFKATMDINVFGTWNVLQTVVPFMKKHGGTIVNISSIAGFLGVFGYAAYGASKFAVFGLSEVLRAELKPHGISVHILCPPDTDTPQLIEENKTKPAETRAVSGRAKLYSPDVVAEALLRGLARNKFLIIPGLNGKFIYLMNRLFPGLVRAIMDGDIKKAGKKIHGEIINGK